MAPVGAAVGSGTLGHACAQAQYSQSNTGNDVESPDLPKKTSKIHHFKCELELTCAGGQRRGQAARSVWSNRAPFEPGPGAALTLLYQRLAGVVLVSIVQNKEDAFFSLFFVG